MRWVVFAALILALSGCSQPVGEASGPAPSRATTIVDDAGPITVSVVLPPATGPLVGPASGRVLDRDGEFVAWLEFRSGWVLPVWGTGVKAEPTGAPRVKEVTLPTPGRYTFELDEYAVSNNPCGTCEQGFSGGTVEVDVVGGDTVELPAGEPTWVS